MISDMFSSLEQEGAKQKESLKKKSLITMHQRIFGKFLGGFHSPPIQLQNVDLESPKLQHLKEFPRKTKDANQPISAPYF